MTTLFPSILPPEDEESESEDGREIAPISEKIDETNEAMPAPEADDVGE